MSKNSIVNPINQSNINMNGIENSLYFTNFISQPQPQQPHHISSAYNSVQQTPNIHSNPPQNYATTSSISLKPQHHNNYHYNHHLMNPQTPPSSQILRNTSSFSLPKQPRTPNQLNRQQNLNEQQKHQQIQLQQHQSSSFQSTYASTRNHSQSKIPLHPLPPSLMNTMSTLSTTTTTTTKPTSQMNLSKPNNPAITQQMSIPLKDKQHQAQQMHAQPTRQIPSTVQQPIPRGSSTISPFKSIDQKSFCTPQNHSSAAYNQQQRQTILQQSEPIQNESTSTSTKSHLSIEATSTPMSIKPTFEFIYSVPKLIEPSWIDCVLPTDGDQGGLYIGNLDAALSAETLKKHRIRAVLTTSVETGFRYAEEFIHFHESLPAHDKEAYDITVHFEKGTEFIERNRKYTSVFVHCFAGVSRSASICIAYMMKHNRWSLEKSLWHLKKVRRLISPNVGFIKKLTEYEEYLTRIGHYKEQPNSNGEQIEKIALTKQSSTEAQIQRESSSNMRSTTPAGENLLHIGHTTRQSSGGQIGRERSGVFVSREREKLIAAPPRQRISVNHVSSTSLSRNQSLISNSCQPGVIRNNHQHNGIKPPSSTLPPQTPQLVFY